MQRLLTGLLVMLVVSACGGGPSLFQSGTDEEDCARPPGLATEDDHPTDEYDDVYVC